MQRRNFIQRIVFGGGVLASATLPYLLSWLFAPGVKAEPRTHLRPPGALKDDKAFVNACIGCGLCGEVCPPKCIKFYQREGGGMVNTPYINPEEKACILCNKCMEVCPTAALQVIPVEKIDMGISQIDRLACYPWVDRGICGACVSICPLGNRAISFLMWNQYRPVVHDACVGCGLCVEICPHPSLPIRIVERSQGTVMSHSI
jgi:ferredoxin-type protein NapG